MNYFRGVLFPDSIVLLPLGLPPPSSPLTSVSVPGLSLARQPSSVPRLAPLDSPACPGPIKHSVLSTVSLPVPHSRYSSTTSPSLPISISIALRTRSPIKLPLPLSPASPPRSSDSPSPFSSPPSCPSRASPLPLLPPIPPIPLRPPPPPQPSRLMGPRQTQRPQRSFHFLLPLANSVPRPPSSPSPLLSLSPVSPTFSPSPRSPHPRPLLVIRLRRSSVLPSPPSVTRLRSSFASSVSAALCRPICIHIVLDFFDVLLHMHACRYDRRASASGVSNQYSFGDAPTALSAV
ncbi:hypothetical protein FKP32DRAFT_1391939 [Trametes sanguinea]|nr:hypothetical protein FKP32DRAFT_1391939 [Trametes sanguinea]